MLRTGDLIEFEGERYLVREVLRRAGVARIFPFGGTVREVPCDVDQTGVAAVIANVPTSWILLTAPIRRGYGPYRQIRRRGQELIPFRDWVADGSREGGPVFFDPALSLRMGEVLICVHESQKASRITAQRMGTIEEHRKRAEKKKPEELTDDDVLMQDDDEDTL